MGTQRITMKTVACILLLATIAYSAEVTQLSEMMDEVVYRISWNTQYDSTPSNTASKGTFKITIKITIQLARRPWSHPLDTRAAPPAIQSASPTARVKGRPTTMQAPSA